MGKFTKSAKATSTTSTKTAKQSWPEIPETVRLVSQDSAAAELQSQIASIMADSSLPPAIRALASKALRDQLTEAKPLKLCVKRGHAPDGAPLINSRTGRQACSISITGSFTSPRGLSVPFLSAVIENADAIRQWLADVEPVIGSDSTGDDDNAA